MDKLRITKLMILMLFLGIISGGIITDLFSNTPTISICNSTIIEKPVEKTILQYMSIEQCRERIIQDLKNNKDFEKQLNTTLNKP